MNKGILTKFEICLILALAQVAYSDQRYFSMSIALIAAVDKFIVDGANVGSCIQTDFEGSDNVKGQKYYRCVLISV
jgi:hypothetical protein